MNLLPLTLLASVIASTIAISCNVASSTGVCAVSDLGALTDTCFQCAIANGPSESSGCRSSDISCNVTRKNCEFSGGNFSSCQSNNCNACDSSRYANVTSPIVVFFLSETASFSLFSFPKGQPSPRLLCLSQPAWSESFAQYNYYPPTPFPFGSDPSVQSILIWNNQNVFTFSSSDCSGMPHQPSQIIANLSNPTTACFYESNVSKILPIQGSVQLVNVDLSSILNLIPFLPLIYPQNILALKTISYSDQKCGLLRPSPAPSPITPPNPYTTIYIISIFSDYVIPLLLLAACSRSVVFRLDASRLTMPRFFRIWLSHSDLEDRYATLFLMSTLNDFIVILILNNVPFSLSFSNWFTSFPVALMFRPLLVCVLFQPDRIISVFSVIEGLFLTANAFLRLEFLPDWMILPRIIFMFPPLMFTLTAAFAAIHPSPLKINPQAKPAKQIATRFVNALFGSAVPTVNFHHDRVAALVTVLNQHAVSPVPQKRLIVAPTPTSVRIRTVSCLAAYWLIFVSSFVYSSMYQLLLLAFGFDDSNQLLKTITVACCFVFFLIFSYFFLKMLKDWRQRYHGRFIIFSTLCRQGLIPPCIQSHTNFQYAAKYMSSETIRIVWNSVAEVATSCFIPAFAVFFIALILLIVQLFFKIAIFEAIISFFTKRFFNELNEALLWLTQPRQLNLISIWCVSSLLSNSWNSPYRLFRAENLLTSVPKRVASCCCLKFRCVEVASHRAVAV
jgi:hypothetical protein